MKSQELIESLVQNFGNPANIMALLSEQAVWTLHTGSMPPGGVYRGQAEIRGLMEHVFGGVYQPESVSVDIFQAMGGETDAAVRFQLNATTTWGATYANDYAVFIEITEGKISKIHELLDATNAADQLAADAPEAIK